MLTEGSAAVEPLSTEEIRILLRPLQGRKILLAVSGGPDSMALMACAARHAADRGDPPPAVATVDHGLRAGSTDEAGMVGGIARKLGLPHAVLVWSGAKPSAGIQEAAREARRSLLLNEAHRLGATALVLAHHRDDQAETVLMRLCAGSGISGLAAMRAVASGSGIEILRPFLAVPKARLVATAAASGLPFVRDPSNGDRRFARARWREAAVLLAAEGLDAVRLSRLAERAARADAALEAAADLAEARWTSDREGVRLLLSELFEQPEEIMLRVLARAIAIAAPDRGFRLERLEDLVAALREARSRGVSLRRTLGGAVVSLERGGTVVVAAETDPRRNGTVGPGRIPSDRGPFRSD
jgi:tRNA(Ile)-lysidine synthase